MGIRQQLRTPHAKMTTPFLPRRGKCMLRNSIDSPLYGTIDSHWPKANETLKGTVNRKAINGYQFNCIFK